MTLLKEIREGCQGSQVSEKVEQNVALATKANKKKKEMSQVVCYQCCKMGHYTSKCREKKKGKT